MKARYQFTPEYIDTLRHDEIFVFGSNTLGQHHGGAARTAHDDWGAEWGKSEGISGQTYAIPTMTPNGVKVSPFLLQMAIERFLKFALKNPDKVFLVTPIGCGIAHWSPKDVATLFYISLRNMRLKRWPKNVVLPRVFCGTFTDQSDLKEAYRSLDALLFVKKFCVTESQKERVFNEIRNIMTFIDIIISDMGES